MSIGLKQAYKPFLRAMAGAAGLSILAALALYAAPSGAQTVPPVVMSSAGLISATGVSQAGKVVQDTCGDLYELETGGNLLEIPAGSNSTTYLVNYGGPGSDGLPGGLAIDSNNNLYVGSKWNGQIIKIPSNSCVPNVAGAITLTANNSTWASNLSVYWYDPGDLATDASSDLFIASNNCCNGNEIFELVGGTVNGAGVLVLGGNSLPQVTNIAADSVGDVFFTVSGSGAVYEVTKANYGTTSPTQVASTGSSGNALGLAFDAQGNLYIGDTKTGSIFEVPNAAASGSGTPALQFGSMFLVASGLSLTNPLGVGIGSANNTSVFYTSGGANIYDQILGAASMGSEALAGGGSASGTVYVAFNAAETPASIGTLAGGMPSQLFSVTNAGTCTAGTAYTAGQSCSIAISYTPSKPGMQQAAVVLADASGSPLASAQLSGTGLGAGLTVDPGTPTALGSNYKTPQGIAVDAAGNVFIADPAANAVDEYAAGSTTAVSVGSGLSAPAGVAVDGAGDVLIADTGNNRIVEVPVVNGALSTAAQVVVASSSLAGKGLSAPAGVTVDAAGNLYIADTGNSRIVMLPFDGSFEPAQAAEIGSGFSAPLAVIAGNGGNLYVADSGNGKIERILWPVNVGQVQLVAANLNDPSALALDASGSLYVVDKGNNRVLRVPNESGSLVQNDAIDVTAGIAAPWGLAMDGTGNLYVSDSGNAAVWNVSRVSTTLSFGYVSPGGSSSEQDATASDSGNQALAFNTPFYAAAGATADYTVGTSSASACTDSGDVAVGTACVVGASFTPLATDSGALTDTLTLSSNAVNANAEQVVLTGTAAVVNATSTTLAITSPANGTPYAGQPITLTATVSSSAGTPTGTVSFRVDGQVAGHGSLNNGTATLTLPNGLNGSSHSIVAVYAGAAVGTTVYGGSTSSLLSVTVTTASSVTSLMVTTTYSNPPNDLTSNAVAFTATVTPGSTEIPTGTVQFMNGTTVLGSAAVQPASGGIFIATFSSTLAAGKYAVTAVYSGDVNYKASSSSASSFTIVSAPNFTLTQSGASISSTAGNPGSVILTLTSWGGWNGLVSFSCSGLPTYAQCVFQPAQPIIYASTPSNSVAATQVKMEITLNNEPSTPTASGLLGWVGVLSGLGLFWVRRRALKGAWSSMALLLAAVLLGGATMAGMTSCGGSGAHFITPSGTSTVTVTAVGDPFSTAATLATQPCSTAGVCQTTTFQVSFTAN